MLKSMAVIEKEAEELINKFKAEMQALTGVIPVIIITFGDEMLKPLRLHELEGIINDHFADHFPKSFLHPEGIRSRRRKREIVLHRYLFYYIGYKMGYGASTLASFLNYDHTTAIHGNRVFRGLLEARDKEAVKLFNDIHNVYQKRIESAGAVQLDNSPEPHPKSVLSAVLYAGIDQSKLDQLAPRPKNPEGE